MSITVTLIPNFDDNYCYHVTCGDNTSFLVDTAEAEKVVAYLNGRKPTHIFSTHHHWDHTGGNEEMAARYPGIQVIGGAADRVPAETYGASHGDKIQIGDVMCTIFNTPCHTKGHIEILVELANDPGASKARILERGVDQDGYQFRRVNQALFTGDTAFNGGAGRFMEGGAKEMTQGFHNLRQYPDALLFGGHEYTLANLKFGLIVEPENVPLNKFNQEAIKMRQQGIATVPTFVSDEMQHNPFMRCFEPEVMKVCGVQDPITCMHYLRQWKNSGQRPKM